MLVNRNEQAQITKRTSDITLNDRNHTLFQVGRPNHRNVQPLLRPMIEPMYLQYTISTHKYTSTLSFSIPFSTTLTMHVTVASVLRNTSSLSSKGSALSW